VTEYEALRPNMDTAVDSVLGDTLNYTVGATGSSRQITGFLVGAGDLGGIDGLKPLPRRIFVKITRALLPPSGPSRADTLTTPSIPGVLRPATDTPAQEGPYWIVELQRAAGS
jgi:hypothetical protein